MQKIENRFSYIEEQVAVILTEEGVKKRSIRNYVENDKKKVK